MRHSASTNLLWVYPQSLVHSTSIHSDRDTLCTERNTWPLILDACIDVHLLLLCCFFTSLIVTFCVYRLSHSFTPKRSMKYHYAIKPLMRMCLHTNLRSTHCHFNFNINCLYMCMCMCMCMRVYIYIHMYIHTYRTILNTGVCNV